MVYDLQPTDFFRILRTELIPAMGCTEPIAIAYASAKARQILGCFPDRIHIACSGNIIKNVMGVKVPYSGGMRGVGPAAVLGVVGGRAELEMEVLTQIQPEHVEQMKKLLKTNYFSCSLQEDVTNLYIEATVYTSEHWVSVTIAEHHTLITRICKDGEVLHHLPGQWARQPDEDAGRLTISSILRFASSADITEAQRILQPQIDMNTAISHQGLLGEYGGQVGRTLLETFGTDVRLRAMAAAAAGSDARMGGCSLPAVINSGSGNQGLTVSMPVLEYAAEWGVSQDTLYRALLVSNLVSIHLKHFIGSLSAFCGAVTAACGAGAAITYMAGGTEEQVGSTIVNTLANISGIVCDGAKASCAAKIASAVDAAILAHHLSMKGYCFQPGEGIVQDDVEATIRSVGHLGRTGMRTTDAEILRIMMNEIRFDSTEHSSA